MRPQVPLRRHLPACPGKRPLPAIEGEPHLPSADLRRHAAHARPQARAGKRLHLCCLSRGQCRQKGLIRMVRPHNLHRHAHRGTVCKPRATRRSGRHHQAGSHRLFPPVHPPDLPLHPLFQRNAEVIDDRCIESPRPSGQKNSPDSRDSRSHPASARMSWNPPAQSPHRQTRHARPRTDRLACQKGQPSSPTRQSASIVVQGIRTQRERRKRSLFHAGLHKDSQATGAETIISTMAGLISRAAASFEAAATNSAVASCTARETSVAASGVARFA